MPDIGTLLAQSRAHHANYRRVGLKSGLAALEAARQARQQAHEADPDHADAAWSLDPVPHADLMSFYQQVLGETTP